MGTGLVVHPPENPESSTKAAGIVARLHARLLAVGPGPLTLY